MYTLRVFNEKEGSKRTQVFLGDAYTVEPASEEDAKLNIKLRVYGPSDFEIEDGFAISHDQHAYIMNSNGSTFETLNKPKSPIIWDVNSCVDFEKNLIEEINLLCTESLDPEGFEKWEQVVAQLRMNRSKLK